MATHIRAAVVEEVHKCGLSATHTSVHVETLGRIADLLGGREQTEEAPGTDVSGTIALDVVVDTLQCLEVHR